MTTKPARRLESDTYAATLPIGKNGAHRLDITIARDAEGRSVEIAFVGRGKPGTEFDQLFIDLGVIVSRAMQNRDPDTGERIA